MSHGQTLHDYCAGLSAGVRAGVGSSVGSSVGAGVDAGFIFLQNSIINVLLGCSLPV